MRLTVHAMLVCAIFTSATDLAFGWSPEWEQCKDVNNKDTAGQALAACNHILNDKSEQPNYAMALRNRCAIRYTLGDYDDALADCNQAIKAQPQSDIGYERRGYVWQEKGDDKRAMADYDKAVQLNPKSAYALYARGLLKKRNGDQAGGDADIARARQIKPDID
jgi:tetratricopeptide (TPR) repeat protein